jgi:hypothetical protein
MSDLRTAAQQGLDAIYRWHMTGGETADLMPAFETLRAALAQPAFSGEPVAWIYQNSNTEREYLVWQKGTGGRNWRPLYTAPGA